MTSFIIKYLLFSILLMGTVTPVLAYVHTLDNTQSGQHQKIHETENRGNLDIFKTTCDHCCHFSAHSVGVLNQKPLGPVINNPVHMRSYYRAYRSLIIPPPSRPPILA